MSNTTTHKTPVGDIRPSQLMFTYGVGAIVDLPRLSVIVMGLGDWPQTPNFAPPVVEERLLNAIQSRWPTVQKMLSPPIVPEQQSPSADPLGEFAKIGVPVATFPRWMHCPICHTLAPLSDGLFTLKEYPYRPDRTHYQHITCTKSRKPPEVIPARFLVACENGHLDDFPWVDYVHRGEPCSRPRLTLAEYSPSGEARDLWVTCVTCNERRPLADAFDPKKRDQLPLCRGRRPHLRDYEEEGCELHMRPLILGASNTWFPAVLSSLAIPAASGKLSKLIEEKWDVLQAVDALNNITFMRKLGQLGLLSEFSDEEIWEGIGAYRQTLEQGQVEADTVDLKAPEWRVFTQIDLDLNNRDFRLNPVAVPPRYKAQLAQVVLVEALREVRAMIGFTRLDAPGELTDPDIGLEIQSAPLTRQDPSWVPASEVRGEGIFIQFREVQIQQWLQRPTVRQRAEQFFNAHREWRQARGLEEPEEGFPGMRYILIHTFAHALMRQLVLECGYAPASIRERLYARPAEAEGGPMAGLLLYTAAPDSEGTLGGLVSLGETSKLERHIARALAAAGLCANDPLCAEHPPSQSGGRTLHAVACHACTFTPETSCERGNKYLDRALLVATVEQADLALFSSE